MRTGGYGRMMYTTYSEVMIEPETNDLPTWGYVLYSSNTNQ